MKIKQANKQNKIKKYVIYSYLQNVHIKFHNGYNCSFVEQCITNIKQQNKKCADAFLPIFFVKLKTQQWLVYLTIYIFYFVSIFQLCVNACGYVHI